MMNNTYFTDGYYYALKRRAARRNAKITQKVFGFMMVGLGVAAAALTGDGTASLLLIPGGFYLMIASKIHIVY